MSPIDMVSSEASLLIETSSESEGGCFTDFLDFSYFVIALILLDFFESEGGLSLELLGNTLMFLDVLF